MKIAFVCEYFYPDNSGGTPTDVAELAVFLKRQNSDIEIDVITSRNLYRTAGPNQIPAANESWHGIEITRLRTPKSNRPSMVLRLLTGGVFSMAVLGLLLGRRPYDLILIVTNPPANALTAWIYSKVRRVPYIYFVNDLYPDIAVALGQLAQGSTVVKIFEKLQKTWLASAARVVVISRCMGNHITAKYEIPVHKISIIRNWADPVQIQPGIRENAFRKANGLTGFVILYGGNFSRYVNFKQMLGAAKILKGHKDITFVLIGDGVQKPWILRQIQDEKLTNVRVLNAVARSTMNEVLAASDVCIISLDARMLGLGSPGKLYSIMASGRPTIAVVSEASEVAMILEEEKCGVTVTEPDALSLAHEIIELHRDPEIVKRAGKNARQGLERRFTLEHAGQGFYSIIKMELKGFAAQDSIGQI